jgi:hypothetical protein
MRKLMMLLVFLAACAHSAAPPLSVSRARASTPAAHTPVETPSDNTAARTEVTPSDTLSEADKAYQDQLGATRAAQLEDERQLFYVKQAMTLYRQFLERADGRPELEPAVRKSHERLEDLQQIADILQKSVDEREQRRR